MTSPSLGPARSMPTFRHMAERRLERTSARSSSPWSLGRMSLMMGRGARREPSGGAREGARGGPRARARGLAHHQPLQEGVAGEAVGPVQAGAGGLADSEEA